MSRKFWTFRNAAEPGTGDLLIYGPIGSDDGLAWLFDELTPKEFRADLEALGDISELRVFINSPGGDVFAGQAIHSILQRHPAKITVYIDGLAASAAVLPVMAGDRVVGRVKDGRLTITQRHDKEKHTTSIILTNGRKTGNNEYHK